MITTTTDRPSIALRRPHLLGAVVAMVLVVAGCSSSDADPEPTTAPPTTVATTGGDDATTTEPAPAATTQAPGPPAPAVAPEQALSEALGVYATQYEFTAVVSVNGDVASAIEGRWLEGSSELSIASGDGVVDYLITGTGQWTRLPDGEWQELDGEPPLNNPLTALSAPTSLRSTDDAAGSVGLVAIYPAEVLGLSGAPVEVLLTIRDAVLTQARYRAIVEGVSVETVTVFAPLENTSPITAPPEVTG